MNANVTREEALELVKKYNQEPFHIQHALTVEGVMRWFARENQEDEDFWGLAGLLHDVDFEKWPEEHCKKAPELLAEQVRQVTAERIFDAMQTVSLDTVYFLKGKEAAEG